MSNYARKINNTNFYDQGDPYFSITLSGEMMRSLVSTKDRKKILQYLKNDLKRLIKSYNNTLLILGIIEYSIV